jgi:hypothetical protein
MTHEQALALMTSRRITELSETERDGWFHHVRQCEECRRLLDSSPEPPPGLRRDEVDRLADRDAKRDLTRSN